MLKRYLAAAAFALALIGAANSQQIYGTVTSSITSLVYGYVSALNSCVGITGDGVTDDSSAIQTCINNNKGKRIVFDATRGNGAKASYLHAGILLSGSTYNKTVLDVQGEFLLKASGGATNYKSSLWGGLILEDTTDVTVSGNFNGNKDAQPQSEQIYSVLVTGATNTHIPSMKVRNVRGDGVMAIQSQLTVRGANCNGLNIDNIEGINDDVDGRQLVSIVSCDNVHIGKMFCRNIGGTINPTAGSSAVSEPGCLDIEPDYVWQSVRDFTIDSFDGECGSRDNNDFCLTNIGISGQALNFTGNTDGSTATITNFVTTNKHPTQPANEADDTTDVQVGDRVFGTNGATNPLPPSGALVIAKTATTLTLDVPTLSSTTGHAFGIIGRSVKRAKFGTIMSRNSNGAGLGVGTTPTTVTAITVANPAVITATSHGLAVGMPVKLTGTGTVPTGLYKDYRYWVVAVPNANTFQVSAVKDGTAAQTTAGSFSGTVTVQELNYSGTYGFQALNAEDVTVESLSVECPNTRCYGANFANVDGLSVKSAMSVHARHGYQLGSDSNIVPTVGGVYNFNVNLEARDISEFGISVGNLTNGILAGQALNPTVQSGLSTKACLYFNSRQIIGTRIRVSCPYNSQWTRAYRAASPTFTDSWVEHAVFGSGWTYTSMIDTSTITTLPWRETVAGLAEVEKKPTMSAGCGSTASQTTGSNVLSGSITTSGTGQSTSCTLTFLTGSVPFRDGMRCYGNVDWVITGTPPTSMTMGSGSFTPTAGATYWWQCSRRN